MSTIAYQHLHPRPHGSGLCDRLLIAPVELIGSLAGTVPGNALSGYVNTLGETEFISNTDGFINLSLAPHSARLESQAIGDFGARKRRNTLTADILGNSAEVEGFLQIIANKPVVVLAYDSFCANRKCYQLGTMRLPAQISSDFATGATLSGTKGWRITVTSLWRGLQYYNGFVQEYFQPQPVPYSIAGMLFTLNNNALTP